MAPPDHHLLVEDGHLTVRRGPRENRFRPSVDALLRSAAYTAGPQVIGVVLSGALDDGTPGLWTVERMGGVTIVRDPSEAAFDSMPLSALREVEVDYTLPIAEIGPCLVRLVGQLPEPRDEVSMDELDEAERLRLAVETRVAAQAPLAGMSLLELAEPSIFSCPGCRGVLLKVEEGSGVRYRCHVGHAYSAGALLAGITDTVEIQLEQALRALEEAVELLQHQHGHARLNGDLHAAALLRAVLAGTERRMKVLSDRLALFDQTR